MVYIFPTAIFFPEHLWLLKTSREFTGTIRYINFHLHKLRRRTCSMRIHQCWENNGNSPKVFSVYLGDFFFLCCHFTHVSKKELSRAIGFISPLHATWETACIKVEYVFHWFSVNVTPFPVFFLAASLRVLEKVHSFCICNNETN